MAQARERLGFGFMASNASGNANGAVAAARRLWPVAVLLVAVVALFTFGPDD